MLVKWISWLGSEQGQQAQSFVFSFQSECVSTSIIPNTHVEFPRPAYKHQFYYITLHLMIEVLTKENLTLHKSKIVTSTPFQIQLILYGFGCLVIVSYNFLMTNTIMTFSEHMLLIISSHTLLSIVHLDLKSHDVMKYLVVWR